MLSPPRLPRGSGRQDLTGSARLFGSYWAYWASLAGDPVSVWRTPLLWPGLGGGGRFRLVTVSYRDLRGVRDSPLAQGGYELAPNVVLRVYLSNVALSREKTLPASWLSQKQKVRKLRENSRPGWGFWA